MTQDETLRTDDSIATPHGSTTGAEMARRHNVPGSASGEGVIIGVQDTGLDTGHPFLAGNNVASVAIEDFTGDGEGDAYGHGTLVADLATRYADGADLVVHRIFGPSTSGAAGLRESFDRAIELAEAGELDVFNMSWGYPGAQVDWVDAKVNELAEAGCIPVSAAGNTGGATGSPATARKCVSVGALREGGKQMTNFSSWDQDGDAGRGLEGVPEVCAIGRDVVGARADGTSMGAAIDGTTTKASGTSFSSPFVAGLVADLLRRRDDEEGRTPRSVVADLEGSADDIPGTHRDGLGRADWAEAAMPGTAEAQVWSPPWSDEDWMHVDADVLEDGDYVADLQALRGALSRQ